jgi:CRISPR/Cas system CMR-associated protein Cmr5 small subunit
MKYIFLCIILFVFIIIICFYSKKVYNNYNKIYESFNTYQNKKTFVLLGDSILNNKTYTTTGKGVNDLLMEKSTIKVYCYAEDYAKIIDVYRQVDNIPSYINNPNTTIFLSSGGNDLLTYYYDKDNNISDTSVLVPMFITYKKVINHIKTRMPKTKLVLLDIYYPDNIHFKQYHPVIDKWNQQLYSYINN